MRIRAPLTALLLAVINVVFALNTLLGGSSHPLLAWGADSARAVAAGQWWRLVTSLFLHIRLVHLAVNG